MTTKEPAPLSGMRNEWFPLLWSPALQRTPVAMRLLDEPLIAFRSPSNEPRVAPAHGWSKLVPLAQPQQASPYCVEERDGLVWCSLGQPSAPAPSWPYIERLGVTGSSEIECNFVRLVENMMDATHAAFIHGGLLRGRPSRLVRYTVHETATGVVKINRGERASGSLLYRLFGGGEPEFSHVEELVLPNWVRAEYRTMAGDVVFAVQFVFAPVTVTRTRLFYRVCSRRAIVPTHGLNRLVMLILGRLVDKVIDQDRWILEAEERALQGSQLPPRRVSTNADTAAAWAGQRVLDFALGHRNPHAHLGRSVEFELRL